MRLLSNLKKVISDCREERIRRTIEQQIKLNNIMNDCFNNCWKIAASVPCETANEMDEQEEIKRNNELTKSIWEAYFLKEEGNLERAFDKLEEAGITISVYRA